MIPVKIKLLHTGARAPQYKTAGAAGADMYFAPADGLPRVLQPGERAVLITGFAMEIPPGYEFQVRPRSGLALTQGVSVVNAPGTIDSDYRGEMGVLLINHGTKPVEFKPGDRIAQMVLAKVPTAGFVLTDTLSDTPRGEGGYGSTGVSDVPVCGAWSSDHLKEDGSPDRCLQPFPCAEHADKCRSPNGRLDGHFSFGEMNTDGDMVCSFCKKGPDTPHLTRKAKS